MIRTFFAAVVTAAMFALPAQAQFTTSGNAGSGSRSTSGVIKDTSNYSHFGVSYVNRTYSVDVKGAENYSTNGVGINYITGISLSKETPIFFQTGARVDLGFGTIDKEDSAYGVDMKVTTLSAAIPANIAYKFTLNDGRMTITPYAGLNFKFNILGKGKLDYDDNSDEDDDYYDYYGSDYDDEGEDSDDSMNFFDKKDMGGNKDAVWKRFQIGWQIGATMSFSSFYVNVEYGTDFSELAKKLKTSTFAIGAGFNF